MMRNLAMNSRKLASLSYVLFGLLGATIVTAGENQSGSDRTTADAAQVSYIDGAVEPRKIPDRVRYGMFVKRYLPGIRDQLFLKLSPQDDAILISLAEQDQPDEYAEGLEYQNAMKRICRNRGNKNAVSLAHEEKRVVEDYYERRVNRYRKAIGSLSPIGREIVETFVENTIVPHSRAAVFDIVAWAKADPASYLENFAVSCHVAETGELPAALQEQFR